MTRHARSPDDFAQAAGAAGVDYDILIQKILDSLIKRTGRCCLQVPDFSKSFS